MLEKGFPAVDTTTIGTTITIVALTSRTATMALL